MTVDKSSLTLKNFSLDEFACPCCGNASMDEEFLFSIDMARDIADIPFVVTSGKRCIDHNKHVGGSANSAHLKGKAADIRTASLHDRSKILRALIAVGFNRLGVSEGFIHADNDSELPQNVVWLY